ncbi:MAG: efflux RND transporter periplasmic adaptor subunit [Prosthecobacter sp.]
MLALLGVAACGKKDDQAAGPPRQGATPVLVGEVVRKDMPVNLRAIGRVTPTQTVTLRPQVTGQIEKVHIRDGQDVKAGDVLFSIDRRPFEVALSEAKAGLTQATAQASNAMEQERRYQTLAKDGAVPQKELETAMANAKSAAGLTSGADATVQKAELNLSYCDVKAPISGRAGRVLADVGNVASAYQTDLVVINQIEPIEVTFAVPEQQLPSLQRGMGTGTLKVNAHTSLPERLDVEGHLEFMDNTVKPNTGTIDMRATFKNDPQVLWPGQYANLSVEVSVDKNAVVAPARAVQPGQESTFVFVVQPDMTVRATNVVVARTVENEAVISEGLQGGEKVVIDGQDRLKDGGKVNIKEGLEPGAPAVKEGATKPVPAPPTKAEPAPASAAKS